MNENFGSVLKALRRENQGGTIEIGSMYGPPYGAVTTGRESSSNTGSDTDSGGREDRRCAKK